MTNKEMIMYINVALKYGILTSDKLSELINEVSDEKLEEFVSYAKKAEDLLDDLDPAMKHLYNNKSDEWILSEIAHVGMLELELYAIEEFRKERERSSGIVKYNK